MSRSDTEAASRTPAFLEREHRLGAHNYHPLPIVIERAEGVFVWDVDGRRYYDCLAAYSAVNQGHCHPRILAALQRQAQRATLVSRAFHNDQLGRFYEVLTRLTGFGRVLPMNTGAEAVETAIKAARKWGYTQKGIADGQAEIVVFDGNFHGRTTTIVGFSAEEQYRRGFGPFAPGFRRVPYGDAGAVAAAITERTCAVLVEPIQGEAGIVVPPAGFLRELRALCDRERVLLMADEIQSGLGRTGRMFCCEHDGVRPDVLILGKALSGGFYPVSAMLADDAVMDVFRPGDHGSTYGGNPLGAAVAVAALEALVDERMVENAATLGARAFARLAGLRAPVVKDVRGKGLWIGIELHASAGGARRFCERLLQRGVLCKETHDHVIRLAPPLVITAAQLDEVLDAVEAVLRAGGTDRG
ncbi:MAG: ornithine--oxo-acid transaminase [Planctomycetes bacterium]|nr:ornithine--oxo-acid transaminase [Planctomycetota bacterium]